MAPFYMFSTYHSRSWRFGHCLVRSLCARCIIRLSLWAHYRSFGITLKRISHVVTRATDEILAALHAKGSLNQLHICTGGEGNVCTRSRQAGASPNPGPLHTAACEASLVSEGDCCCSGSYWGSGSLHKPKFWRTGKIPSRAATFS